jgi:hypothetical protein
MIERVDLDDVFEIPLQIHSEPGGVGGQRLEGAPVDGKLVALQAHRIG